MKWMVSVLIVAQLACGEDTSSNASNGPTAGASGIDVGGCIPTSYRLVTDEGVIIEFEGADGFIPLNQLFSLRVTVSGTPPEDSLTLFVDATMPAHGHGMNTVPTVEPESDDGHFLVSNMNLHMPGEWELSILVMYGEVAEQVRTNVQCSEGT